jgi:hypothetical protein
MTDHRQRDEPDSQRRRPPEPTPSDPVAAEPANPERPGYGRRQWGVEEQGGWRGPGEGPGYRSSPSPTEPFQQGSVGGQVPGEYRQWGPSTDSRGEGRGRTEHRAEDLAEGTLGATEVDNELRGRRAGAAGVGAAPGTEPD